MDSNTGPGLLPLLPMGDPNRMPVELHRILRNYDLIAHGERIFYSIQDSHLHSVIQKCLDFYNNYKRQPAEVLNINGGPSLYKKDTHDQDLTFTATQETRQVFLRYFHLYLLCLNVRTGMDDFQDLLCRKICTQYPVYEAEIIGCFNELQSQNVNLEHVDSGLRSLLCERMLLFRRKLAANRTVQSYLNSITTSEDQRRSIMPHIDTALSNNQALLKQVMAACNFDQTFETEALMHHVAKKCDANTAQSGPVPPMQQVHQGQPARPTQPAVTPQHAQPTQLRHSNEFFEQPRSSGSGLPGNQVQPGQQVPRSPRTQPIQNQFLASNRTVHFEDNVARNPTYGTMAPDTADGSTKKRLKRPRDSDATARFHAFDHLLNDPSSDYETDTLTTNRRRRARNSNVSKSVTSMSGYETDSFTPNRRKSARRSNVGNYYSNDRLGDFLSDYENDNSDERVGRLTQRSIPNANNYGFDYPLNDRLRENTTNSNIFTPAREHAPNLLPEANRVGQVSDADGKIIFTEDMYKPDKYIKPTKEGEYWFVSQEKWDNFTRGSQWLYHRAFLICETTAGKVAEQPCTECHHRGIECRVFADPKKGSSCAYCIINRSKGCSHNAD